jgi:hypothetical protein
MVRFQSKLGKQDYVVLSFNFLVARSMGLTSDLC